MKINKYFPFAFIYFFVNSLGLPFGLTYTTLLSPLLYVWVVTTRKKEVLWPFFLVLAPFIVVQVALLGVDIKSYTVSLLNLTAVYIFCQACYTFFKEVNNAEAIFSKLLKINFLFCFIAIPFYFTSYYYVFWIKQALTEGVTNFLRLKMFTYEASYYATLFTPLFFFFFLQILLKQNKINAWMLLCMLALPYLLSFSMGVISCIILSILITYLYYFKTLTRKKRVFNLIVLVTTVSLVSLAAVIILFPDNVLFVRISNVFSGQDVSGKSRTSEAFVLGMQILEKKSYLWGIGLGQIKILGADIIRDFYSYQPNFNIIAIPNAAAETLTIFGFIGFTIRILLEVFLFFHTRVWTNYYRLFLFVFIFIYQFTGSFITNVAEYTIWILAFTNVFPMFDVKRRVQQLSVQSETVA